MKSNKHINMTKQKQKLTDKTYNKYVKKKKKERKKQPRLKKHQFLVV